MINNLDYLDDLNIGYWLNDVKPRFITGFCNDTRKLSPGECFLAIRTDRRDGNIFLAEAKKLDATCAFVNYPQPEINIPQFICSDTIDTIKKLARIVRQNFRYPIVSVTGSMGKTTTKDILSLLLNVENNKTHLNENNQLGILMTIARLKHTEHYGIIEIGIDEIGSIEDRLAIISPSGGIVTGVCGIHMENFGSEENIAREKCKLAEYVTNNGGHCIFSEELLRFKCFRDIKNNSIVPSNDRNADVYYTIKWQGSTRLVELMIYGTRYVFHVPHLMSNGTMKNFILSVTYALFAGIRAEKIQQALQRWQPSYMRGMIKEFEQCIFYVDCYNANLVSFRDSLENFDRLFQHGSRLFIIGCLSQNEVGIKYASENRTLGYNLPLRPHDVVIIIGDDANDVSDGIADKKYDFTYTCLKNPQNITSYLRNFSGVGYVKGHRFYRLDKLIDGV